MHKILLALLFFLCLYPCVACSVESPLEDYVNGPDHAYDWELQDRNRWGNGTTIFSLRMTSQRWRGQTWDHRLQILVPDGIDGSDWAVLFVRGDGQALEEIEVFSRLAKATSMPMVILSNVPNQPLFGGRREDEIIAYTFSQFRETGDPSWPLLLPMVKSASRGMDAVQEFFGEKFGYTPSRFVVSGASKRGWTSWLAGAVDSRVRGIVPMVYDNLNLPAQMENQLETWGQFSNRIDDYTELRLTEDIASKEGKRLVEIVDPYSYRDRLTQPKLIIVATNDRYWPLNSLNLYYEDLPGRNYIYYVPNQGHGINDVAGILKSFAGFLLAEKGLVPWPDFQWSFSKSSDGLELNLRLAPAKREVEFWGADSNDADFRDEEWRMLAEERGESVRYRYVREGSENLALFARVKYSYEETDYYFCTPVSKLVFETAGEDENG